MKPDDPQTMNCRVYANLSHTAHLWTQDGRMLQCPGRTEVVPEETFLTRVSKLLPPHVDGEESEEELVLRWVERMALVDTRLQDVLPEKHDEILAARSATVKRWFVEASDSLMGTDS